jgi:non-specific serine/threonine protein kinase
MPARRLVACLVLLLGASCRDGASPPAAAPEPEPATSATTSATTTPPASVTTSTVAPAPPPVWQARSPAPTARQEVASAVADGRVWVIGGLTAAGATAVESYDPVADRWAPGPALPVALHHAMATTFRGEVVVMGGFLAAGALYDRPSDRVLALRAGGWVDLPPLRRPRGAGAAAVAGDVVVIAGGRNVAALVGPTEIFDGSAWRDAEAIPTRRDHLSAASDGRSVFTVGGRFLSPGALSAALERFDPVAGAWERLPALPTARGGQGAAMAGGRLVVAGGEDPSGVYAEVEAYDVAAERWSVLPAMPTPRHGLSVEFIGDRLLALVGGTAFGVAPSAAAEALGPLS